MTAATVCMVMMAGTFGAAAMAQPGQPTSAPAHPAGSSPAPIPGARPLTVNDLERVAQGGADSSALGVSLRATPAEMRVQTDFSGLYRIPMTARTKYAGWYAREQGGVIAVFPQSEYHRDQDGNVRATIPAGTVFLVGGIPQDDSRASGASRAENGRVSIREDSSIAGDNGEAAAHPGLGQRHVVTTPVKQLDALLRVTIETMVTDDQFAGERVSKRLEQALTARPPEATEKPDSTPQGVKPTAETGWRTSGEGAATPTKTPPAAIPTSANTPAEDAAKAGHVERAAEPTKSESN